MVLRPAVILGSERGTLLVCYMVRLRFSRFAASVVCGPSYVSMVA
jgi:hypothetical protein